METNKAEAQNLMFLNEKVLYEADDAAEVKVDDFEGTEGEGGGAEVTDSVESFTEAMFFGEKAWNTLSMKMVRLEHTAIVNNDTSLMEAGVKEFGQKVVQWFKDMWAKIKAFIDKIIKRVQDMIDDRRAKQFADTARNFKEGSAQVSAQVVQDFEAADNLNVGANIDDGQKQMDKATSNASGTTKLSKQLVQKAYVFLTGKRRQVAGDLKKRQQDAQKACNEGIKAAQKGDSEGIKRHKEELNKVNSSVSYLSKMLNKGIAASLSIMVAARKGGTESAADKAGPGAGGGLRGMKWSDLSAEQKSGVQGWAKANGKGLADARSHFGIQQEKASILDQF